MNNNHKNTQPSSKQHQIKVANKKKQKNEKGKQMVYECL